ncbi:MAG: hypothetical protein Q4B94_01985 [Pseudomonadota bacterium]|nr:hypothetical protein [Pseudomonadota bacterium]
MSRLLNILFSLFILAGCTTSIHSKETSLKKLAQASVALANEINKDGVSESEYAKIVNIYGLRELKGVVLSTGSAVAFDLEEIHCIPSNLLESELKASGYKALDFSTPYPSPPNGRISLGSSDSNIHIHIFQNIDMNCVKSVSINK